MIHVAASDCVVSLIRGLSRNGWWVTRMSTQRQVSVVEKLCGQQLGHLGPGLILSWQSWTNYLISAFQK